MRWYRYVVNWSLKDQVDLASTLRQIAQDFGVSYETIRRTVKAAHKRARGESNR